MTKILPEDELWDEWFDKQYELTNRIDRAIDGLSQGRDDQFRVSLYVAVIEHSAEAMRAFLHPKESEQTNG